MRKEIIKIPGFSWYFWLAFNMSLNVMLQSEMLCCSNRCYCFRFLRGFGQQNSVPLQSVALRACPERCGFRNHYGCSEPERLRPGSGADCTVVSVLKGSGFMNLLALCPAVRCQ